MPMASMCAGIRVPITYVSSKEINKKDTVADMASSWTRTIEWYDQYNQAEEWRRATCTNSGR